MIFSELALTALDLQWSQIGCFWCVFLSQQYNYLNNMVLSTIWLLNLLNVVYFPLLNKIIKVTLLQWHPFYIHLSNISLITVMLPLYLKRTWVQLHFVHWIEMHCMKDIAFTETSEKEHLKIQHCTFIGKRNLFSFSRAACFQAFLTPHHRTRWLLRNIEGYFNLKISW